jgi:pentapeptide MXKDX repeat protein
MKTLLLAAAVATGLAFAPAAFAEDVMSKPGTAKDTKMDNKMDKKTDAMAKPSDKMQKSDTMMMDKKDSMSKDGMKK